jgi:hypothetical protein
MKAQCRIPMTGLLVLFVFAAILCSAGSALAGEMRGSFVRLTELRVEERGYLGIIVKPRERGETQTIVVPRQPERLAQAARKLRQGQIVEIVYAEEAGHKWVKQLEFEGQRTARRRSEEARGQRSAEAMLARIERMERQIETLRAEVARLKAQLQEQQGPKREVRRTMRGQGENAEARARKERRPSEREVALEQLEVMRVALHGLKEGERGDAVELLTLAIRSREMMLEGRRGEEANRVRERAPKRAQLAELLALAARLWREFDHPEKAAAVGKLAKQMAARGRQQSRQRSERPDSENAVARQHIKIMRYAMEALLERERKHEAELLEQAIHARELALEGKRDERAMRIREQAPSPEAQIEILSFAGKILKELGRTERAQAVNRLAQDMKRRHRSRQR